MEIQNKIRKIVEEISPSFEYPIKIDACKRTLREVAYGGFFDSGFGKNGKKAVYEYRNYKNRSWLRKLWFLGFIMIIPSLICWYCSVYYHSNFTVLAIFFTVWFGFSLSPLFGAMLVSNPLYFLHDIGEKKMLFAVNRCEEKLKVLIMRDVQYRVERAIKKYLSKYELDVPVEDRI